MQKDKRLIDQMLVGWIYGEQKNVPCSHRTAQIRKEKQSRGIDLGEAEY